MVLICLLNMKVVLKMKSKHVGGTFTKKKKSKRFLPLLYHQIIEKMELLVLTNPSLTSFKILISSKTAFFYILIVLM